MNKILLSVSLFAALCGCTTDTKNRHVFHYTITGSNTKAADLYGKMGPGIEFNSKEVDIPFEILNPLLKQAQKNAFELGPKQAQTGPAIRNDEQLIQKQSQQMTEDLEKMIYQSH